MGRQGGRLASRCPRRQGRSRSLRRGRPGRRRGRVPPRSGSSGPATGRPGRAGRRRCPAGPRSWPRRWRACRSRRPRPRRRPRATERCLRPAVQLPQRRCSCAPPWRFRSVQYRSRLCHQGSELPNTLGHEASWTRGSARPPTTATMTETIETADLVIAYERSGPGDGRPVVLTHGWPDDVHCWDAVVGTLLEGLDLRDVVLAGHDWGARASYVASVLVPERVRGLVALSVGYGSTSLDAPISFEQARAYWYQWFFATPKGRRTLEHDRPALCRHLWRLWAPSWKFTSEAFDETASAWDNPDWLAVTVHSYTHRWGGTPGDPAYEELEAKLARNPPIQVPTIVLHGSDDGATLVTASEDKDQFFTAGYERRVLEGVGHFVPREAPSPAAKAILRLAT